ncbi:hypothetical protein N8I77_006284 [Diaporthe amygdali]|uniref:Peptidase A1 domain-containing protein n=1 Tax=Phomopsis amygdali TaxID=1214568 RepID=A0AAD9SGD1_PHOAM|nr:hypothetical protein N8I77_006284 [Diaporthe amygdali]
MYRILTAASLVLLLPQSGSAFDIQSLTRRSAGSGTGYVHIPVQHTVKNSNGAPMIRRRASGKYSTVDLENLSSAYSINISIAGQDTTVIVDTGSSELWVDPDCSTAARGNVTDSDEGSGFDVGSPQYCESIGRYDPDSSSTSKDLEKGDVFVYADLTTIELNYYSDNIDIGGLEIKGQQFGVANVTNATALGIMGMGPNSAYGYNSSTQPYSLILDSMASQGLIASRAFSLDLKNYDNATGSIIFGGLDKKKFLGSLQTLPLESPQMSAGAYGDGSDDEKYTNHGYFVTVQSLSMTKPNDTSSSKYDQDSFLAVLDSGTSAILTPEGMSSQICNDVGGTEMTQSGSSFCTVPCDVKNQPGGLDVEFQGKTIRVAFENLFTEVEQDGYTFCFLGVGDTGVATDPPTYILGSPFLRAAYAVFDWDNQQVHLAQASDCGSNVVAIGTGGTAACVVAGRLAEADPELSILVIEGGQDNFNVPNVVNPVLFYQHLLPTSKTALFYKAKASEHLAGRESIVPSGGTLGGGSSINFMMYTRSQREDFDSWNTPGWTANDILPFMRKLETYHGPGDADKHGYSGPIHVSSGGYSIESPKDDYINVLETYGGLPVSKDMQSLDANNCCERSLKYVSPEGKRQDAAHTFLHPKLQDGKHPNLHVLVETKVVRVLFDENKKACGVEVTPNPDFQLQIGVTKSPKQVFRARKLVVVSCGANGTPSVLERSGIGGKEILDKAGVPVVVDLPGVGSNWQDHHLILLPFKTSLQPRETGDLVISGRVKEEDLIRNKDKILGWNLVDVGVKMQPSEADRATLDKDLLAAWERDFKDKPNKPLMLIAFINGFVGDHSALEQGQYVLMANYTAYPYSRGSMHITGPDLDDALDFDVGFFSDPGDIDLKKQVWAYKKQREFMRRTQMFRGEVALGHPKFSPTSKAALVEDVSTLDLHGEDVQDLEYSAEDDKVIEQFLRENIQTTWHSIASCRMAPREDMGVVDGKLSVYGVQNLKLADLSIPPENVGANTNNTALVIGEKAADIIAQELGLPRR